MKPIISTTIILGAVSLLLLFQACNPDKSQETSTPQSTDSTGTEDIDKKAEMIAFSLLTGPVSKTMTALAKFEFELLYSSNSRNLQFSPVKVELTPLIIGLFKKYPNTTESGLVLHYGLSHNKDSLQYILSLGEQKSSNSSVSSSPFPADTNSPQPYYILFDGKKQTGTYINNVEFCVRINKYRNGVKMKIGNNDVDISAISNHPYFVYHQGRELDLFIEHNKNFNPSHLHIIHGVGNNQNATHHMPILVFGNSTKPLHINNNNEAQIYKNKALDVGHLCPSLCNTEVTTPIQNCNP